MYRVRLGRRPNIFVEINDSNTSSEPHLDNLLPIPDDLGGPEQIQTPEVDPSEVKVGDIWSTKAMTERGRMPVPPKNIFVVKAPRRMPNNDYVLRGIVVSDTADWPEDFVAEDEIAVGDNVFHLWVNFPVSTSQLEENLGTSEDAGKIAKLAMLQDGPDEIDLTRQEHGVGNPIPETKSHIWDARDNLLQMSQGLTANADRRMFG